jgi:hypothetical protein
MIPEVGNDKNDVAERNFLLQCNRSQFMWWTTPLPASSAIGWFVGDGGKAHCFTAVQKVVNGTLRHSLRRNSLDAIGPTADKHQPGD